MNLLKMYKKLTQDEKEELIKSLIKDINEYQNIGPIKLIDKESKNVLTEQDLMQKVIEYLTERFSSIEVSDNDIKLFELIFKQ